MLETILVIDDDTETCRSIANTLESKEYLVFSAEGENVGITLARRTKPLLIFVNPAIAGGRGLEICKKLREMDHLKNVPIIAISSPDSVVDKNTASLYGIIASLQKPFSSKDLVARTKEALSMTPEDVQAATIETIDTEEVRKETVVNAPVSEEPSLKPDILFEERAKEEEAAEQETPLPSEKTAIRARLGARLPAPLVVAVVIVMLGAAGFIFYNKSPLFEARVQKPASSPEPVRKNALQNNNPLPEPQKTAEPAPTIVPAQSPTPEAHRPVQTVPAEVPASSPKPESAVAAQAPKPGPKAKSRDTSVTPRAETKGPDRGLYSVQVGVFKKKSNAASYAKRFEKKGYKTFVYKSTPGKKRPLYRVLIGKYKSRKEASRRARKLNSEWKIKTAVFKR